MVEDNKLFAEMKESLLNLDPIYWIEKYLTLNGKPFRLNNNGYKPFADVYRYIGCISIQNKSKPVVLVKSRGVGATTMAAAIELYFMASDLFGVNGQAPMRIMHVFPLLEMSYKYSKTALSAMISNSVPPAQEIKRGNKKLSYIESKLDTSNAASDNLQFKQFQNSNHLFIESTGLTADRLRGARADMMLFDEIQDIKGLAIGNALKILNKAQYGRPGWGAQVYFGTPKQRGTEFWKMWNNSSQQYYHLGCIKCGKDFPFYTPDPGHWEKVWIQDTLPETHNSHGFIVKCTFCGHEQDKRQSAEIGKWVPYNNGEDTEYLGYHINQVLMPEYDRKSVISQKPEFSPINSERTYQNEVMGEFYQGDASPITPEEIDKLCADMGRKFAVTLKSESNRKVYMGVDWGLKVDSEQSGEDDKKNQGRSYSCVVIISTDGPHILNIEYAYRLKRNDLEYKKSIIEEMFRRYNVDLAVGDIGYANDLTEILQKEWGERFLASESAGRVNGKAKFKNEFFPSRIVFERNYWIADMYSMLKAGKIRFPFGDYEKVAWLVDHISSMEIKTTTDRSGDQGIIYVKGSTPNDGAMALMNCLLARAFDISDGFKITNPNNMNPDPGQRRGIPAITSYLPRFNPLKR